MAVLLGCPVTYISTIPDDVSRGRVRLSPKHVGYAVMILLAGLFEDGIVPEWPVAIPTTGDEVDLQHLITEHNISESDYRTLTIAALKLSATRDFQLMMTAVTGTLDYVPVIDTQLLDQVITIAERNRP
jgi:hypothetical protein